jgi:hypothetical protein
MKRYLPLIRTDRELQKNFILGLQANTDDDGSECVDAYNLFIANLDSIESMKENVLSKIDENGANLKDYGKYITDLKNYFALMSIIFNFYE